MSPYRGARIHSVLVPLSLKANVFRAVPTCSGFWITLLAAVTSPIDSSIVLPASYKADADRCNASPIPAEVMAKLFKLLLSLGKSQLLTVYNGE